MKALFIYSLDPNMFGEDKTRTTVFVSESSYNPLYYHFDTERKVISVYDEGMIKLIVLGVFMVRVENDYTPQEPNENSTVKE